MKRTLLVAAAVFAATPAVAANVDIAVQGPVVEITASETVQSEPDQAAISAGVTTREPTAVASMQSNAKRMATVIARLRALGIAREDIQTSGVTLNAAYDRRIREDELTFLGYDVTNQLSVIFRDIDKVGSALDALVAAGANDIEGPTFSREDDKPQRIQAREAAYRAAEKQARDYARLAGFGGVRLLAVEETLSQGGPIPFDRTERGAIIVTAQRKTPIEPGRVGTLVQLTAKYEMTR